MRIVLYTQRVEVVESYGERRDCADQNIAKFLAACGYIPVPVPNNLSVAQELVLHLNPIGIVFTGGNSLVKYGGNAPERDEVEQMLLKLAIRKDIPVYGFCRGMQLIEDFFGAKLENVQEHVAVRHKVYGKIGKYEVNSYHNQACLKVPDCIEILAYAEDGTIEALQIKKHWILATMWHPEREVPFKQEDIIRVKKLFGKEELI